MMTSPLPAHRAGRAASGGRRRRRAVRRIAESQTVAWLRSVADGFHRPKVHAVIAPRLAAFSCACFFCVRRGSIEARSRGADSRQNWYPLRTTPCPSGRLRLVHVAALIARGVCARRRPSRRRWPKSRREATPRPQEDREPHHRQPRKPAATPTAAPAARSPRQSDLNTSQRPIPYEPPFEAPAVSVGALVLEEGDDLARERRISARKARTCAAASSSVSPGHIFSWMT